LHLAILILVILTLVQQLYIFNQVQDLEDSMRVTAKAVSSSGTVGLCLNHPPLLNSTCNMTVWQNTTYTCLMNATDEDGDLLNFSSSFQLNSTSNATLFNMTMSGFMNFSPNQSEVGVHTLNVKVSDDSACSNTNGSQSFNMVVLNINDPPEYILQIPNQTWTVSQTLPAFVDLDDHFFDLDGDVLRFEYTILNNIEIFLDSNNEVTLIPIFEWTGTEYITFIAFDPYGLNVTSGPVQLIVNPEQQVPEEEERPSGGGGGGGIPSCIPQWYCKPWGDCLQDGQQHRICVDLNNCSNNFHKPNSTQPCNFVSTCYDGIQGPEEEGIDCGGVCPACPTCFDGLRNQMETGIDCGGPCDPCAIEEVPETVKENSSLSIIERPTITQKFPYLTVALMSLAVLMAIGYLLYRLKPAILKWFIATFKERRKKKERLVLEEKFRISILEKIARFQKKIKRTSKDKLSSEFAALVREYFANLLKLERQLAYEEIIEVIRLKSIDKETKLKLTDFFRKSTAQEYGGSEVKKEDFYPLCGEFLDLIKLTSISLQPAENEVKAGEKFMDKVHAQKIVDTIFIKVSEAHIARSQKDIMKAASIYKEIVADYKTLPLQDQHKVWPFITNLYKELQKKK